MSVSAATIRRIANLDVPVEAMREMFLVLAEQWELDETRKASHAASQSRHRQRHSDSTVISQCRQSDISASRVLDKPLPLEGESKNPPVSPPLFSKPLPSEPDGFAEFWAIFPKRRGTANRKAAVKAFGPALKRTDLQTIIDAARAYAADMKASNKLGTEFVSQARTWLNNDLWTEYQPKTNGAACQTLIYVKENTPAWEAWVNDYKQRKQRGPPRDFNGGWYFPTEYPPPASPEAGRSAA